MSVCKTLGYGLVMDLLHKNNRADKPIIFGFVVLSIRALASKTQ